MRGSTGVALVIFIALTGCGKQQQTTAARQSTAPAQTEQSRNAAFWKEIAAMHFSEDRTHLGSPMPAAQLIDQAGHPTSLAKLKGRPVLVNFWAHWCVPCRAEMPTIDAMAARRGAALQVVAVNEDAMHPRQSLGELPMGPAIVRLTDEKAVLTKTVADQGLPITVLYGSDGAERWRLTGVLDWTKPQATKLLNEAN